MRTRVWSAVSTGLVALIVASSSAWAAPASAGRGKVGLGFVLGSPSGIVAEFRLDPRSSIELTVGEDYYHADFRDDYLYLHATYLYTFHEIPVDAPFALPLYFGVGGIVLADDHGDSRGDELHVGARGPFGIAMAFRNLPMQVTLEVAMRVLIIEDNDFDDRDRVDVGATVGWRYFF